MSMTDLEICKRIAEIEGYKVSTDVRPSCGAAYVNMYPNNCYGKYNPLAKTETGKALCFELMVKHKIEIEWWGNECATYKDGLSGEIHDTSPQRAICLAIIEADEENKK